MNNKRPFITMVKIGQIGRFGNQMFQFAALRAASLRNDFELKIPIHKSEDDFLNLSLDQAFNISCATLSEEDINNIDKSIREMPTLFGGTKTNLLSLAEWKNTNIYGFFQSEKFFEDYEDTIRKDFVFKTKILEESTNYISSIRSKYPSSPLISVHVRRGDYLKNKNTYPIINKRYIKKSAYCLQNILQKRGITAPPVWIVRSDDIPWCKNHLSFLSDTGVTYFDGGSQFVDMCTMSLCDHNIIANSSFSWWAAWLNTNKKKIIIAPLLWYTPYGYICCYTIHLPQEWIRIGSFMHTLRTIIFNIPYIPSAFIRSFLRPIYNKIKKFIPDWIQEKISKLDNALRGNVDS